MRKLAVARVVSLACAIALGTGLAAAPEDDPHYQPVKVVAPYQLAFDTPQGSVVARYAGTGSLDDRSPAVVRALINIHGLLRNADVYEATGEKAIATAHAGSQTLLITPQFLTGIDVAGHGLPPATARWDVQTWLDGFPASGPAPVSAFDVIDAIVARLADRARFPALREIVVVGHSAGGQLVQRYAVIGRGPETLARSPVAIRFVVANPSSYLYFDATRPVAFDQAACPRFNHWKYGPDEPPPYVGGSVAALETRYVARRVTYLLGMLDVDPNHPVLDKSCAAEAEGAYRLGRGLGYVAYLHARHPSGTKHDLAEVAGVGHDADAMFTSACGLAVLFNRPRNVCAVASSI
jgi:pimeloyl-ACP methyl ester carboxylesterase